jgi:ornithine cyclodeaminase
MLFLSANDVKRVMTMKDAIESDREAFIIQAQKEAVLPVRTSFDVNGKGVSSFMPAYVSALPLAGIKVVSTFEGNRNANLPVVTASVILTDPETGAVNAIIDGTELTRLRTGAVAGLATSLLSNEDSRTAALFGTGGQAASQLEALLNVRRLEEVRIFDSISERIRPFIEKMSPLAESFGTKLVESKNANENIDGADIVTTVTTATTPVFDGRRLKEGAHVNGVGSYIPDRRELDTAVITRASAVFVDNMDAIMTEAGDILIPIEEGNFKKESIRGELGDLILGFAEGRTSKRDITVMKTVGFATLDVVAGYNIYQKAIEAGIGTKF